MAVYRRRLLSLLAAGVSGAAGCSAFEERPEAATVTPAAVPTVSESRFSRPGSRGGLDAAGAADLVESTVLDRTYAASVDAAPSRAFTPVLSLRFTAAATDRHPTLLAGRLTNPSDTERTVETAQLPLFGSVPRASPSDGSADDAVVLSPTPNHELARHTPRAERTPEGRWRLVSTVSQPLVQTRPITLGPGEAVRFEYRLLARSGGPGFPTGQYRFGRGDLTASLATWPTSRPGPTDPSAFDDPDTPSLSHLGTVTWYHDAGPGTAIFLRPSVERLDLPGTVTYRLYNRARTVAGTRWLFLKQVDGSWFELGSRERSRYRGLLRVGETETWSLSLRGDSGTDPTAIGPLGGGRYAFVVDVGYSDMVHAALLDVAGPPLSVTPQDGLAVDREDATVTVTHPSWTPEPAPGAVTVRLTRADEARRGYIPEQVLRDPALRNTLGFVDSGVETVVLRADRLAVDLPDPGTVRSFRFQGQAYRLRVDAVEEVD